MTGFDEALEQSINALHAGASIDDCLASHPEHAAALAPLLGVATALYAAPREDMAAEAFARQRQRMRDALQARAGAPTTNGHVAAPVVLPPTRASQGWRRLAAPRLALLAAALLVAVILGLSGVTLASARAEPDEPLYPVKVAVQTLYLNLPADNVTRAERLLGTAADRLKDSAAVCQADPGRAAALRTDMRVQREAALRWLDNASGPRADRLRAAADDLPREEAVVLAACAPRPAPTQPAVPAAAPVATSTPTPTATTTATATPPPTATRAPTQPPTPRPTLPPTLTIAPAVAPPAPPSETATDAPPARRPAPSDTPAAAPPAPNAPAERPAAAPTATQPPPPPPATATQPPPPPATATQPPPPPPPPATATQPPPPPPTATVRVIEVTKPPPTTPIPRPNSVTATPRRP